MPDYDPESVFPEPDEIDPPKEIPTGYDQARAAIEQHIAAGLNNSRDKQESTQGELAAAKGEGSEAPTSKWTDEDRQVAQSVLGRFQAPKGLLNGEVSPDEVLEWGRNLHQMQQGIDAKTSRYEARIQELEGLLVETARGGSKPTDGDGKPQSDPALDAASAAFAEALGLDAKEIGPALEKLTAALRPKEAPAPVKDSGSDNVAEAVLVESARSELAGEWPGLKNDALYADVLNRMATLQGPHYDSMPIVARSKARMRDACTLVIGSPQSADSQTQTRDQVLRGQPPRPTGKALSQPKKAPEPIDRARSILAQHGIRTGS